VSKDPWLNRWLSFIALRAGDSPVLALGCGTGEDSLVLASAGHRVVGIDLSAPDLTLESTRTNETLHVSFSGYSNR
jgi:2-polyprenyl-3-methyl-5-hydroxy-6-metoxy-1,4-benzoquinol methylase